MWIANDGQIAAGRECVVQPYDRIVAMYLDFGGATAVDRLPSGCVPVLLVDPQGPAEKILYWIREGRLREEQEPCARIET